MFLDRFSRLSNLTFCGSNSYPKQGTNVCLIRYSIYSTLKTLPMVEEVDLWFCRSLGNLKAFLFVPSVPRSPVLRMAFDTCDVSGGPCVIEWSSWRMLPWWGFQVGCWHHPRYEGKQKTPSAKWTNLRISRVFWVYFRVIESAFCMHACFLKTMKIQIKLFPIFICWYRSFSEPEQKTSIWNHVTL